MSKVLSKPVFTTEQFDRLSNIFDNAGQVIFGVVVLTPLISPGFANLNLLVVLFGVSVTLICWLISMILAKRSK